MKALLITEVENCWIEEHKKTPFVERSWLHCPYLDLYEVGITKCRLSGRTVTDADENAEVKLFKKCPLPKVVQHE